MSNNGVTPLGKKVDLGREVQGTLGTASGAVLNGYSLGTTADGQPMLQGLDAHSALAFYRLQAGTGVTIAPSSDGNSLVITSSVLAGNTPGVMLQSTYDPSASGTVAKAASVPWSGITGLPLTFPPTVPISESNVTNLVSDLASKVATTRMVNTSFSIQGGGPLSGDLTISLIGDHASVGPNMRYGTNATSVLGWYPASVGAGDMTMAVYDPDNDGIVEQADTVAANGVNTAAIQNQAVTNAQLALGVAAQNLGYTPVNKVGDTMSGQLAVLMSGPNVNPNMYQNAHLFAEVAPTGTGYPTIGLARLAPGGGSVAIWYNSGHQDLNLEYADGTSATLLSSISSIPGGQLATGSVHAGALASGVAQANLGYRPVNWNGDQMTNTGIFVWQRECGLASTSWEGSPIRVQCSSSVSRPQIAFWHIGLGYACALYYETDGTMRTINAGGAARILMDDVNSPYAWAMNYAPVNRAGDTMTGQLRVTNSPWYTSQPGQVYIQSTDNQAGIVIRNSVGYQIALYLTPSGTLNVWRYNDNMVKQLFP